MQFENVLAAQLAPVALVRFRGIGEAITEDNLALIERWLNHLGNVLCARGEHQSHFCQRRKTLGCGVEQHASNFLARRRSPWLSCFHNFISGRAQRCGQFAQLSALASSIKPFEGDEFPAPRHRGMIAALVRPCTAARFGCYSLKFCLEFGLLTLWEPPQ